ncbi:uncharacterized protein LOC115952740 [Quercus lobata]|uniref:uncharacterized protein LOC115952740 n=1 Tax=Quercus lobata TaxID=97700 RepID=UPI001244A19B|nr:uncharacterized protein LOC115952740 [Quercus lobata]
MDSRPFSSFTDVLQGNINLEDELFSVSESSPLLVEDSSLNDEVATSKKKSTRGINFSAEEDKLLVVAWLNTNVNPVYGNKQHKTTFYGKVAKYFKDHKTDFTRSVSSLTSRWGTINRETVKFYGSLAKIEAKNESGTTTDDKDFPKWATTLPKEDSRKEMPQTPDSIDQGGGVDGTMVFERPISRKAKKANRKRKDDGKDVATEYLKKKKKILEEGCAAKKEKFISMGRSFFRELLDDDSDEDEIIIKLLMGSTSQRKHRQYIDRNHLAGHRRLYDDYFAEEPVYPPKLLQRRFRMRRSLFLRILFKVEAHELYFIQKRNAAKKLGLSPLQKMTVALRMLAYGVAADFMDEYVRITETTAITSMKKFVATVVAIFSEEYLRSLNNEDIARLLAHGQNCGFLSMLGSIDSMHWKWKNCPTAWKGMYCGHIREPTIILEAVASYDLWI